MSGDRAGAVPARVVLVEDDAAIRRLVELALEDLPVDLVACADAAQARQALRDGAAALLLTDLMMPGESGLSLLQSLAADPRLRGPARLAVFSAGVDDETRAALAALGVWRVVHKPASMAALQECVMQALAAQTEADSASAPGAADAGTSAVQQFFGGDRALFLAFRASCQAQFAADIVGGDAALAAGDLLALRRLGHSLGSVLLTLGHADAAAHARALDEAARAGGAADIAAYWQTLRATLCRMQIAG